MRKWWRAALRLRRPLRKLFRLLLSRWTDWRTRTFEVRGGPLDGERRLRVVGWIHHCDHMQAESCFTLPDVKCGWLYERDDARRCFRVKQFTPSASEASPPPDFKFPDFNSWQEDWE